MTPSPISPQPENSIQTKVRFASELKRAWQSGAHPNLEAVLDEFPSLSHSVAVDLAIEAYFALEKAGAPPSWNSFCSGRPSVRASVEKVVSAHKLLEQFPELLTRVEPWPEAGDRLEGCEILGTLGRGSSARVYLAADSGTGRICVIKLSGSRSNEGLVIGGLRRHPHVTDVYWARPAGGRTAICMPFVGTTTLTSLRKGFCNSGEDLLSAVEVDDETPTSDSLPPLVHSQMSFPVAVAAILGRVADALAHLHSAGFSHGDLKPSNVVIAAGGHPFLIDFHLATRGSVTGGTLPYMAPEVLGLIAHGQVVEGGPVGASDMYSFGIVLHEVLTGHLPLSPGEGDLRALAGDLLSRIAVGVPVADNIPSKLKPIIVGCLSVNPKIRPSASDVARQLEEYVAPKRQWRKRFKNVIAAVALVTALVFVGQRRVDQNVEPTSANRGPSTVEDYLEQGRSRMREGKFNVALADFTRAYSLRPDPRIAALQAYCEANDGLQVYAVAHGKKAISEGHRTPAVLNNLAFSLSQSGDPVAAIACLDEAEGLAPPRQEILFNRAVARMRIDLRNGGTVKDPRCPADMLRAVSVGDVPSDAFRIAGDVFLASTHLDEKNIAEAIRCYAEAVKRGVPPDEILNNTDLRRKLGNDQALNALALLKPGVHDPHRSVFGLIEPD